MLTAIVVVTSILFCMPAYATFPGGNEKLRTTQTVTPRAL